ncbi:hypothetical protein M408DRAFT_108376 [Serendipita vermifera MAFF 305830]|uniref:Uncharacterized protein n=1 Tax=Serendipita vermifera MAFF 305830 TaxID=933852 RepID=A0A0C3AZB9_SERVB|nr:hypothetical protein M408DRAFT_108376 [Serendipita vermifera MAFF 305830]
MYTYWGLHVCWLWTFLVYFLSIIAHRLSNVYFFSRIRVVALPYPASPRQASKWGHRQVCICQSWHLVFPKRTRSLRGQMGKRRSRSGTSSYKSITYL